MAENGFMPEAAANGRCSKPYRSENNSISETASPAGAGGEEATSSVEAGEAAASTRSAAGATADTESTQAAEEASGREEAAAGRPPTSKKSSAVTAANGKPLNSVLRSSIARYGSNSYYYAHAGLPGAAEENTKFAKVAEAPGVVTGGPPILLGRNTPGKEGDGAAATATDAQLLSAAEAAAAAVAGKRLTGFTVLQSYMWTDDGARVSVYVQLEKLPETPEEKAADPCFDADAAAATFEEECAALVIHRKAKKYLLNLNRLYFPIKPSESRTLIKNDKIILRLVKEDENLTWFGLMKSK